MRPVFDVTPEFERVRIVAQATRHGKLQDIVAALRTLGEEVRGGYVPIYHAGVCYECATRHPEWDGVDRFRTVADVLLYVAWHWQHATVEPTLQIPATYFCDAVPGTHRWKGENLSKRLEFIEFAIDFLEGYAKCDYNSTVSRTLRRMLRRVTRALVLSPR